MCAVVVFSKATDDLLVYAQSTIALGLTLCGVARSASLVPSERRRDRCLSRSSAQILARGSIIS